MRGTVPPRLRPTLERARPDDPVTITVAPGPRHGRFRCDSHPAERFWLPVLGPTATAVARLAAEWRDRDDLILRDVFAAVGVNLAAFVRAVDRLRWHDLGELDVVAGVLRVEEFWPAPPRRKTDEFPGPLRAAWYREVIG